MQRPCIMNTLIFVLIIGVGLVNQGYGFECLVSNCQVKNGSRSCEVLGEIKTCQPDINQCFTMTVTMTIGGVTTTMTTNNCTSDDKCTEAFKNASCPSPELGSCDIKCCNEDRCNVIESTTKQPIVDTAAPYNSTIGFNKTAGTAGTSGPIGSALSCFECQKGDVPLNTTNPMGDDCTKQAKCKTATDDDPSIENGCGITRYQRKDPKTGKTSDVEIRGCLVVEHCKYMCQSFNNTGDLVSCNNVECCKDNLCNGDAPKTTPSPSKAGQNACSLISIATIIIGILVSMHVE